MLSEAATVGEAGRRCEDQIYIVAGCTVDWFARDRRFLQQPLRVPNFAFLAGAKLHAIATEWRRLAGGRRIRMGSQ